MRRRFPTPGKGLTTTAVLLALSCTFARGVEAQELSPALDRLDLLDRAEGDAWDEAFDQLVALGPEAASRALLDFADQAHATRRARARLVAAVASVETIPAVMALADDPDPVVRRIWMTYLGDVALAEEQATERVRVLLERALSDPDREVRMAAVDGLAESVLPDAVGALDSLLDRVPVEEALHIAALLGPLPGADRRLVARVQENFTREPGLADPVLAVLLEEYGTALADLPRGGSASLDRVPFVLGRKHRSTEVRRAAWQTFNAFVARLLQFGELDRVDVFLADLARDGFDPEALLYRRAGLMLSERGDPDAAIRLARALGREADHSSSEDAPMWRFYALVLEGGGMFARKNFDTARMRFERAAELMQALLNERLDLLPEGQGRSKVGGTIMADRLSLLAMAQLWQGLCFLGKKVDPRSRNMLERMRGAHETLLRARVMAMETGSPASSGNLDALFERDLGPWRLVLSNPELARWGDGKGAELMLELGNAMATVTRWEMPGFRPAELGDLQLTNPLADPRRFAVLEELRLSRLRVLEHLKGDAKREASERGELARPRVRAIDREIRILEYRMQEEERRLSELRPDQALDENTLLEIFHDLASYLEPSLLALSVGANLRVEGRQAEARALGERLLADLERGVPGAGSFLVGWVSARAELMIGSTYMDEDRPLEAEELCLAAERRLQTLENSLVSRRDQATKPEELARLEASIQVAREHRANALLSLAVNANVRMGDSDRALAYFERAFELDQREFMQVLLACYSARSGKAGQARAVLRGIQPSPGLYYNLACTYALLGDDDLAIDYLQRDFLENHPTQGSLTRQQEWAIQDPDLASLRENPRFQRLVGLESE